MKKLFLLLSIFFLTIPLASAYHPLGTTENPGFGGHPADCGQSFKGPFRGLGESFDKRPFSSLFYSSSAVSTSPYYTLSTTSECADDALTWNELKQIEFISQGFDNLSRDMAHGNGEYIQSLAALMGCSRVYPEFAGMTQRKFETLLEAGTPMGVMRGLKLEIAADPKLSAGCTPVS